ncbi:MAG: Phospholipid-binding protein [Flavipsychrobacter sp.]|jgi:Raf kinase inhibitor-like YbhB/YbcL family protein|nr:Phospholipid-binding protein [Flavipsychrobacter sp.]
MRTTLLLAAVFVTMSSFLPDGITITSSAFRHNLPIPTKYSCEGENINPPLDISGIPEGTQSVALIMHDPDAPMKGGFTHWVMWNIKPNAHISEKYNGAEMGMNSARKIGYIGMCPPTGTHHYHFTVYALDTKLSLTAQTDKAGLEEAMKGHILAESTLTGLYKKTK